MMQPRRFHLATLNLLLLRNLGAEMKDKLLTLLLAAMLPGLSFAQGAQNYQCTYGDLQRRVEILYETGVTVPCEVHYYKDTEAPGEPQVLWRAMSEEGYCERKAQEFVAKLGELGWTCGPNDAAAMDAEPVPVEDAEPVPVEDAEPVPVEDAEPAVEPEPMDDPEPAAEQ